MRTKLIGVGRWAFLLLLAAILLSLPVTLREVSFQRNVIFGQAVWNAQSLILKDALSWSMKDFSYPVTEWLHALSCFAFAKVIPANYAHAAFVLSLALFGALGVFRFVSFLGASRLSSYLGIFVYLILSKEQLQGEAYSWGIIFTPLALLWLLRLGKHDILKLLLLSLLWVNTDQGAFVLPWSACLLMLGTLAERDLLRAKKYALICLGLTLLSACNPETTFLAFFPWQVFATKNTLLPAFAGFSSPNYHEQKLLVGSLVALILALLSGKRQYLFHLRLLIILAVTLVLFTTHLHWLFFLFAALVLGETLGGLLEAKETSLSRDQFMAAALSLLLIPAMLGSVQQPDSVNDSVRKSVAALSALLGKEKADLRLLHTPQYADLLLADKLRVFLDRRGAYFHQSRPSPTGSVLSDYQELSRLEPKWEQILDYWNFDGAILTDTDPLCGVLIENKHWQVFSRIEIPIQGPVTPNETRTIFVLIPPRGRLLVERAS